MDAPAVKAVLETVMDMDASWDTGVGVVVLPSFITLQAVVNKARNNRVNLFISLLAWFRVATIIVIALQGDNPGSHHEAGLPRRSTKRIGDSFRWMCVLWY
jgi:hypothetical protein